MTRPSHRREMAGKAVAVRGVSIALACRTFDVSETCYRYKAKLNGENESLNSTVVAFDESEPFFAALNTLIEQVGAVGELPIEQR